MADETERKREELGRLFLETPEMREYTAVTQDISNTLDEDDTVPFQLHVPRQFLQLVDFLEQKRALQAGVSPVTAERTLNQMFMNLLHEELHSLITEPLTYPYYLELWNRFCDAQGAPEQKIVQPAEKAEGPF
jgi:hypothetical protein